MPTFLTDSEIALLLSLPKTAPADFVRRAQARQKRGHRESSVPLVGPNGEEFDILVRRAELDPMDFSVILRYLPPETTTWFRLRRHNGNGHEHTNHLENETFDGCHIHMATERYQRSSREADSYAEPTDRYSALEGALECMIRDSNIVLLDDSQGILFRVP